jgi:hypothetical protein
MQSERTFILTAVDLPALGAARDLRELLRLRRPGTADLGGGRSGRGRRERIDMDGPETHSRRSGVAHVTAVERPRRAYDVRPLGLAILDGDNGDGFDELQPR